VQFGVSDPVFAAIARERGQGGKVVASWLSVDKANPAMPGYYGNRPSGRIDWERATRPRHPDDPTERTLLRCTDAKRFIAMKRRKHLRATRTISCGRNVPPVAIPIRPLKLHKRRVKQTETTGRHIYDIDTPPVERHDRRRSMPPALQTHGLAYKRWIGGIRGHAATNRTRRHLSIAIDIASELRPSVGR